jgi:aminopeptidase-like protein
MVELKTAPLPTSRDSRDMIEMETIYKELSKSYCICNHKKDKHMKGEYQCEFKSSEFKNGKITNFVCQCNLFSPISESQEIY